MDISHCSSYEKLLTPKYLFLEGLGFALFIGALIVQMRF
jgi:hypothetical protein